jgi:hypothetical protein
LLHIFFATKRQRDEKRFVVRAGEKLTAFVELESAIRVTGIDSQVSKIFANSASLNGSESGGGLFPR